MTTVEAPQKPFSADAPQFPLEQRMNFASAVRAEWLKLWSVRSAAWTLVVLVVLGAGLNGLVPWLSASWFASPEGREEIVYFVTWGMMFAQVSAIVLGALIVTNEYGSGMIRSTLAAVPRRSYVFLAKALVVSSVLFVAGTVTAFGGYFLMKWGLSTEGIAMSLGDEGYLRAMFGSGIYLAALGLMALGIGFIVRHTAAALSLLMGVIFVLANLVILLPGTWGEWVMNLTPGNAGATVGRVADFNPHALDPWASIGVFGLQTVLVLAVAYVMFRRRDA